MQIIDLLKLMKPNQEFSSDVENWKNGRIIMRLVKNLVLKNKNEDFQL